MASLSGKTLLFIGCGNMGSALALGARSLDLKRTFLYDIDTAKSAALADQDAGDAVDSIPEASAESDVVVLAIKPQQLSQFLSQTAGVFRPQQIFISVLAGVRLSSLAAALPCKLVRAMPNMPALVNEGMTALCGADAETLESAEELFGCVGAAVRVEEKMMDAVTAISGSGPAYLFYFAEAMLKAAQKQGFDPETAKVLVNQTLLGSVKLLNESEETAEALRMKVTSPGGTTEAGLRVLKELGVEDSLIQGVAAAVARSRQLGS
jgi:pyrroline-5-carboxylate reductase